MKCTLLFVSILLLTGALVSQPNKAASPATVVKQNGGRQSDDRNPKASLKYSFMIEGDFCQAGNSGRCTTTLHPENPNFGKVTGEVRTEDGKDPKRVELNALSVDNVDISFRAPDSYQPAWLILFADKHAYKFPFPPPSKSGENGKPNGPAQKHYREIVTGDFCLLESGKCTLISDPPTQKIGITGEVRTDDGIDPKPVNLHSLSVGSADISFDAPADYRPAWLILTKAEHSYKFPLKVPSGITKHSEMLAGDFCQADPSGDCATTLNPQQPDLSKVEGEVRTDNGIDPRPVKVNALSADSVDISFDAPVDYRPAWLILFAGQHSYKFPYTPAAPVQTSELVYTADDLYRLCNTGKGVEESKAEELKGSDCSSTGETEVCLQSLAGKSKARLSGIQGDLLFAHITAPLGEEPAALIAWRTGPGGKCEQDRNISKSVIVRRTVKPGQNMKLLRVDMTIMDQETAGRNFGQRIAKRYLAVTLDVKNPTSRRLQFKKSAVFFDLDYAEAKQQGFSGFFEKVPAAASFGLSRQNVYKNSSFIKTKAAKTKAGGHVFRFGLEQNVKHSPLSYMSILGSFDHTTERSESNFKVFELLGSVLTTVATGGYVAQIGNTAFRDAATIFSGTFLPGLRGIVLNVEGTNRRRNNLVMQTLQEVIEVPPNNSVSTVVLLPRYGILTFKDAEVPVIIDRVLDVHLEPEVISDLNQRVVAKNKIELGYTKDEVRQALGEPNTVTATADGTSVFKFAKGPFEAVNFNDKGLVSGSTSRSLEEQLKNATTMMEAKTLLNELGLSFHEYPLADDGAILMDIPGANSILRFGQKGNKLKDHELLFDKIEGFKGQTKKDFEKNLSDLAKEVSTSRAVVILNENSKEATRHKTGDQITYHSPDLRDERIYVFFNDGVSGKPITDASKVDRIAFSHDLRNAK